MRACTWLIAVASLIAIASAAAVAAGGHSAFPTSLLAAGLGALFAWAVAFACWAARRVGMPPTPAPGNTPDLPQLLLDEIPGLVSTLSADGLIQFVNRQTLEFYGRPLWEMRDWTHLIHPEDRPAFLQRWQDSFNTGLRLTIEFRTQRADGSYRWMSARISPLRDAHGRIVRWCKLLTDIDDHKRVEEALRASERHLRLILDGIPAFIHTLTPAGEVEHVNQRIIDFFGLPNEELRDWSRVTHPDDVGRVSAIIEHALKTGTPFEFESRGRRADGVYRWMHGRGMPLRASDGQIIRWYSVFTDVDDRRHMEEALRASERQLRLMADSIPGLICTNTAAGDVDYVNKNLLDYTGKALAELRNWPTVVHPEDLPRTAERWQHAIETGDPFDVEVRVRRADGAYRWFQCSGLPLHDSGGKIVRWYNLLTDIEDRLNAEEALRDTRARLARATQVATVGEVSASIAHEINQPLSAVVTNGHACLSWLTAEPPNMRRALLSVERIIRDGKAAADVIQRIRALYRHAPPNKDALSINDVIEEVRSLIAADVRRQSVSLRVDLQETLPPVLGDRVQLQQVISNLARNAIEAMETVTTRARELQIVSLHQDRRVVVQVRDTGTGMPDYANAFEPFFTTKAQGMGMGLAICRSIVEAHDGQLRATRATPAGSVFSFTLPAAEGIDGDCREFRQGPNGAAIARDC